MATTQLEKGINIGGVQTLGKVFLAPMHEVSDRSFRQVCMDHGCGLAYSEMVNIRGLIQGRENTKAPMDNAKTPATLQLFGSDAADFAKASEIVERAEGIDMPFSIIDINMGCPAPKIFKNGDGSALLRSPRLIENIVASMRKACGLPITVKIRRGVDYGEELATEAAKAAEAGGACAIAVHPRYRAQYYEGRADWSVIAAVKRVVSVPVIGNGDIRSGEDAVRMMEETSCDAVMIGRAALGNPWIFAEASAAIEGSDFTPPSTRDKMDMAVRHARLAFAHKGERGIADMRSHFGWYTKGIRGGRELRVKTAHVSTLDDVVALAGELAEL